ncbi:hypothetical protein ACFLX9_04275, partial [Chloroflexota bacterium]
LTILVRIGEIALTIFVWRRGWRWWSLLPIGLVLLVGFVIGVLLAASRADNEIIEIIEIFESASILLDLAGVIPLVVMATKGRKPVHIGPDDVQRMSR